MKLLVCGGRDFGETENERKLIRKVLQKVCYSSEFFDKGVHLIINGAARGADSLADEWAINNGIHVARVPALWDYYDKRAGYNRNWIMRMLLDPEKDAVLAFPGGRGTNMMISLAKEKNITVFDVKVSEYGAVLPNGEDYEIEMLT